MASSVRVKHSTSAGNVPAALLAGELAVNHADRKVFARGPSGAVEDLAKWIPIPFEYSGLLPGIPSGGAVVGRFKPVTGVTIITDACLAVAAAAPSVSASIAVTRNGGAIGRFDFSSGAAQAYFLPNGHLAPIEGPYVGTLALSAGDLVEITVASADDDLTDLSILMAGIRTG